MNYDLEKQNEIYLFKEQVQWLLENKKLCELSKINKTRSNSQNSALHLYFTHLSRELNKLGITHEYKGISGQEMETPFNELLVKEFIWRPLQVHLFKKESTTKLTTQEMNEIITVLNKFFADRGVYISFPSIETLVEYQNK